uniref:tRNA/rRNA methyltransferase SpoU type domain-containing protein n=1 Tax=Amphora coffeiformis TaxID=265554 RepID=A0A7S3L1W2_9STRA
MLSQQETIPPVPPRLQVSLVIANIQKRRNIQALISTALAMGVTSILIVGQPKLELDPTSANNTIPLYLRKCLIPLDSEQDPNNESTSSTPPPRGKAYLQRFAKWNDCIAYLRQHAIPLAGVEIDARAITVQQLLDQIQTSPQQNETTTTTLALVMGNEGQGLSVAQLQDCDLLVRLPQYGVGTASYNVYVAASLVLQRLHQYQTTNAMNEE